VSYACVARSQVSLLTLTVSFLLVVYTFKDLAVIQVNRDDELIASMTAQLDLFFHSHFRAALLNKYFYKTAVVV